MCGGAAGALVCLSCGRPGINCRRRERPRGVLRLKISVKPPDADHPYGHGKAEPIAAVIVGLSLIAAAIAIILESIHGILTPHPLPKPYTLVVLAGVLVVKELLFRHVGEIADKIGSTAVRSDAWHHRSDAITSMFAFIGISTALLGGLGAG